ncbi:MAG: DUF4835 family protein [Ignavibacteriae bacterium]|nr:DUF4835 family protein [Ignavibacteriota bacterium]
MKKLTLILLFVMCSNNFAQELNAKVVINTEQLETLGRDNLENFDRIVEDYLNNNKFTSEDWQGEQITCNFSIFFNSFDGNTYNAQAVITSQRPIYNSESNSLMLKVQDNNVSFIYEKNQSMYFNPSEFNSLTSLLDYYAFVIIGLDMDSYQPLAGNEYFNKASDIAILGSNSAFSKGWALETSAFNKRGLVEDLLRSNFQQFRIDFYDYHYNGLDLLSEDKDEAVKNIAKLVTNLDGIYDQISRMNLLLKVFFDTKHKEIFSNLKDYPDKSILKLLKKIDPTHISTYEQGLED